MVDRRGVKAKFHYTTRQIPQNLSGQARVVEFSCEQAQARRLS